MSGDDEDQYKRGGETDERVKTGQAAVAEAKRDGEDDWYGRDAENLSSTLPQRLSGILAVFGPMVSRLIGGVMAKVYQAIEINERKERDETRAADDLRRMERRREKEEEAKENFESSIERMEREQKWDRQVHTIGGIQMTGAEWDEALETLSDPVKKQKLQSYLMKKNGWSKERAEKAISGAEELALIAQKEKDGTITAADRARADEITRTNPDSAVALQAASKRDYMNDQSLGAERQARDASWDGSSDRSAVRSEAVDAAAKGGALGWGSVDTVRSPISAATLADAGAVDAKVIERPFASAPDLKKEFEEAKAKPADAPSGEVAPAAPAPQVMAKADLNSAFG